MLNERQARDIVENYMANEQHSSSTQDIISSGAVPRLNGYVVQPGKVSDSIYGGTGSFKDKASGETIEFENPPLNDSEGRPVRIMVRTDRVSTHDISRGSIPFKDQILAANHNYMRRLAQPFMGSSQYEVPGLADTSVVTAAENLNMVRFENVLRAYMAKSSTSTSLYQHFMKGEREFCGHVLPENLFTNGPLPYLMDTPSTKDENDMSVSPEFLFNNGITNPADYAKIQEGAMGFFQFARHVMLSRGMLLVDTKFEHGINSKGEIVVQDEILTLDSSRFWIADEYFSQLSKFVNGKIEEINPKSFSKEFARGFSKGDEGYNDEQRLAISVRYIIGIQKLLDAPFIPEVKPRDERVIAGLEKIVDNVVV